MEGIGLEGHFIVPNPPLIRAVLDKLAILKLPIWLTEVDISKNLDKEIQIRAKYVEMVLREGFSHPGVNGIILWSGLHSNGCYQMCLTDTNFHNLPAGDIVDNLLKEWQTGVVQERRRRQRLLFVWNCVVIFSWVSSAFADVARWSWLLSVLTIAACCVELMLLSFFAGERGNWWHHFCVAAVAGRRPPSRLVAHRLELLPAMEVHWWSSCACQSFPLLFAARSPG
ncbi:hypothetical protein MTR67_032016 [Solanum verrucosum]|uniref:GH10 domain-containing protein n=1 Tax=Solanum verrucosum TaxID=315347 RepID=A0AAF0U3K4_SOLVR|nr:hypothetical protein MTR67_032016 [Solanum verrucosum]